MFTKSMLFSALLTVATLAQAAVPGEIIAVYQASAPSGWAVVSPDGSNLTYLPCVGDPTQGGAPRFFLSVGGGGNVLHVDNLNRPDRWSNELVAADENCEQSIVLSNEGNKVIFDKRWSPDSYMIAMSAEQYDPALNRVDHSGIYLADVIYTSSGPTGVTNFRQVVETSGVTGLDWSPDSRKIVYTGDSGDLFTYEIGTGIVTNITNTPGISRQGPTWSSRGRIAYHRVSEPNQRGDRIDIFSIPEYGGAELRITSKSNASSPMNMQSCYSPDGQYLSFTSGSYPSVSAPMGDRILYKIKADGTGKPIKIIGSKNQSWRFNHWRR
jgi:Tol biopolymer transport system component